MMSPRYTPFLEPKAIYEAYEMQFNINFRSIHDFPYLPIHSIYWAQEQFHSLLFEVSNLIQDLAKNKSKARLILSSAELFDVNY